MSHHWKPPLFSLPFRLPGVRSHQRAAARHLDVVLSRHQVADTDSTSQRQTATAAAPAQGDASDFDDYEDDARLSTMRP